jgi:hypothetical protein
LHLCRAHHEHTRHAGHDREEDFEAAFEHGDSIRGRNAESRI